MSEKLWLLWLVVLCVRVRVWVQARCVQARCVCACVRASKVCKQLVDYLRDREHAPRIRNRLESEKPLGFSPLPLY